MLLYFLTGLMFFFVEMTKSVTVAYIFRNGGSTKKLVGQSIVNFTKTGRTAALTSPLAPQACYFKISNHLLVCITIQIHSSENEVP